MLWFRAFYYISQENVWPSDETEIFEKAAALNRIADTCLQRANTKGWTATNFKRNVVDKLYVSCAFLNMCQKFSVLKHQCGFDLAKCKLSLCLSEVSTSLF